MIISQCVPDENNYEQLSHPHPKKVVLNGQHLPGFLGFLLVNQIGNWWNGKNGKSEDIPSFETIGIGLGNW